MLQAKYQDVFLSYMHIVLVLLDQSVKIQSTQGITALEKSRFGFSPHCRTMAPAAALQVGDLEQRTGGGHGLWYRVDAR